MTGGYRYDQDEVRADDVLPTAEVIALAKGFAAKACAEKAASAIWSNRDAAEGWIARARYLALAILERLCPAVPVGRLARCIGMDPLVAEANLRKIELRAGWTQELVDALCRDVIGGGA